MGRNRKTVRIYFKSNQKLHKFYWLKQGRDGSIYFGSSPAANHFKFGYKGEQNIPKTGKTCLKKDRFLKMSKKEISGKYSFHKSGEINTPSKRHRYKISDLKQCGDIIPLIGILPMKPVRYPISKKKINSHDIILKTSLFKNQPFAILMFLTRKERLNSEGLYSKEWDYFRPTVTEIDDSLKLCIYMYADSSNFLVWPKHELEILAKNKNNKNELAIPIVRKLPNESYWRDFR